jgi:hypothetical protein
MVGANKRVFRVMDEKSRQWLVAVAGRDGVSRLLDPRQDLSEGASRRFFLLSERLERSLFAFL